MEGEDAIFWWKGSANQSDSPSITSVSFKSLKDAEDAARAREEDNDARWQHAVQLSLQRAPIEEAGRRFFADERQRLLEDAAERRALFTGLRRERRRAEAERRKRNGGDGGAGPSNAPPGGQ